MTIGVENMSREEGKTEYVRIPKWYLKALLIILAFQVLLSVASIALNLWINFKLNIFWSRNGQPIID
jgi:hypothetical protein